ncbi:MAM domain-containing protein [Meloidogyne graminicola]|uniref:MAM domain-containing protein n=1 Tax=Meloidogyne graminicola TaxID=189291 RepID=A0A8S9ZKT8_9BILA|nr:MAM domain-containing protein [Meloidogyne graminicola]
MINLFINYLILFLIFYNFKIIISINCTFENKNEKEDFCGWELGNLWKTGNAVLVDSVNSVVHSSNGEIKRN